MSTPPYDPQSPGQPTTPPSPYTDYGAPAAPYGSYTGSPTPPGQPPAPAPYGAPPPRPASEKRGLAIAALVLGIVALLGCWIPILNIGSILLGLVGIVLGIVAIVQAARGTAGGKVMAIVGVALSVVAIVLSIVVSVLSFSALTAYIEEQPSLIVEELEDAGLGLDDLEAATSNAGGEVGFEETYTYDDGLAITVSAPQEFTPGEYAVGTDGEGTPVLFEITIDNGSDTAYTPALLYASVTSAGAASDPVFDMDVDSFPSSDIAPDKSLTFSSPFMVADVDDVQMEIDPGFMEYETLTITS
ncbi:DUF4190 domain-containing protein [Isoptericola croceus]|uniref:DUF4190 domain-containing protein n=1 Tax=Isoptericola croceus TaxID=3031406 RepID=UPI0023F91CA0|nr:DUF4190 domain-containing protein [Isoptericola croceus]